MPPQCIGPPVSYSTATRTDCTKPTHLPLSGYELPTATFVWPPWHPHGNSEAEPGMYVNYRRSQISDTDSNSTCSNSTCSLPRSRASPTIPTSTPLSLSVFCKRSSSGVLDHEVSVLPSPSDRFLKLPRVSNNNTPNRGTSACIAQPNSPTSASHSAGCTNKDATRVYHQASSTDSGLRGVELRKATYTLFYPASQSNSSGRTGSPAVPQPTAPVGHASAPPVQSQEQGEKIVEEEDGGDMNNVWIKYAYPSPERVVGPDFACVWEVKLWDGTSRPCGYHSKKHLLRRHIESKHLKLRPRKCRYCGKGFSQKSNLDTHLNTHTGDTPHKCHYCEMCFGDPSRRHRHMTNVHQHRSSRTKKDRGTISDRAGPSANNSEHHDIADLTTPAP